AAAACRELVNAGLLEESKLDAVLKNLSFTLDWDETIAKADFIVEAVPKVLKIKQDVFERCGNLCSPETIVTSTASSLGISEIAARMKHPERALVTHCFIPAHVMPIVEVVPGKYTSDEAVQLTKAVLRSIGKKAIVCKESPGFIHNYIQIAMTRAAISLVDMGIATAEDVDTVVMHGFAMRLAQLGPIRSADYAGLETLLHVLEYVHEKTGDSTFKPPAILKEKVASGELGLKSHKGFYTYSPEEVERGNQLANDAVMRTVKA
ncbi:MAG TPA: 3-hydroxyacyl-CoA dehydrogenase family protein, partial [Terriglobales bacterium]|nr:3-hydroxyacyl-CoA dehydrogenase family protein [Terriglobales bacterium]